MSGQLWNRKWIKVATCLALVGTSACGNDNKDKRHAESVDPAQNAELVQTDVAGAPSAPQDEVYGIIADQITTSSIRLRWRSDVPSRYTEGYRIAYKVVDSSNLSSNVTALQCPTTYNANTSFEGLLNEYQIGTITNYTLVGLAADRLFEIRICSKLSNGITDGARLRVRTAKEARPPWPFNLTVSKSEVNAVTINWETNGQWGDLTPRYIILMVAGKSAPTSCSSNRIGEFNEIRSSSRITQLSPGRNYTFRICTANANESEDTALSNSVTTMTTSEDFFDDRYYVRISEDVRKAIENGVYDSGAHHFSVWGRTETYRPVHPMFDSSYYLAFNQGQGIPTDQHALLHFIAKGAKANLRPSAYFDPFYYGARYPEVNQLVATKKFESLAHHFWLVGLKEKRRGANEFDEAYYLSAYPDVANGVASGVFASGLEHYVLYGRTEGRFGANPGESLPMFRAYNPNADYHFFTVTKAEYDNAVRVGLRAEGSVFRVFPSPLNAETFPLSRLYNPNTGFHYYTASYGERDALVKAGWRLEREEGYVSRVPADGLVELFRLYNRNTGTHLYTPHVWEKDAILQNLGHVWEQHASVGYVMMP